MNIQQLSQLTGISIADVRGMCQGIVNSMIDDGFKAEHLEQTEAAQIEIAGAYLKSEGRKLERFTTEYLTNPEARECFIEFVLADLRGAA